MSLECFKRRLLSALLMGVAASAFWANAGLAAEPEAKSERVPLDEVLAVSTNADADPKSYWQELYRKLLRQRVVEEKVIEAERELYADANRRNYRRGTKRHVHRDAMLEAIARRGEVEERLVQFQEESRRAGILPGWLYEVEETWQDTPIALPSVGAASEEDPSDESERAGRNPIHFGDEAEE